jgi:PKHD-type hydroxylase
MLLHLREVLKNDELKLVREWLAHANFVDGRLSAGTVAKRVKNNEELDSRAAELERLNSTVMSRLVHHAGYRSGALPLHVASPYYARYQPGMAYGNHLDDPIMGADGLRYRSDIAITIFLNAPEDYGGGELVIQTAFGSQPVKLAAGDGVLYPAGSIHQVNPVTRGERLVAITWAQSLVRDPARRELLYELGQAREKLLQSTPDAAETAQVNAAYLNLIRMWSEI